MSSSDASPSDATGSTVGDLSPAVLGRWLGDRLGAGEALVVADLDTPKAGFSNETIFFRAGDERFVLRRAGAGVAIYPEQVTGIGSIETQRRVLEALDRTGFGLAPEIVASESGDAPLGRPFFVMRFVAGRVLPDYPSYTEAGFFREGASPEVRRRHVETGLAALAALHRVDWRAAGLEWLDRDTRSRMTSQLALWRRYVAGTPGCRDNELLGQSLDWLEQHRPDEPLAALSWGDARIQNMIFDEKGECLSIVDWEGAAILPPEVDLAWWLGVDHFVHEASGTERLPGELDPDEQVAFYERRLGRPVRDLPYYRVFAAFRTVALMISTYDRLAEMGVPDAGSADASPLEPLLAAALARAET
jgi:aminoglycoside phosphotransferase (APT) family kinase protein